MLENIIVQIGADISQFTSQISQANGTLDNFGQNMSAVGSDMAKGFGGAALAIGAGLGFAVNQAADFDTQIRKAGAIAGASAKELDAMKASALDLGATTSESASSVANAMTEMAAKGFTANQTIAAMPGIIAAAEASGEDLALAADTVSSALNIWGLEAAESSRVADVLAMSANVSAAGIDDLGYVLKYAGGPAAALGISLEEVAAAAGIMTNAGLDGSNAGTALRASILALNNPATAQRKMMEKLGISMKDNEGNALGLSEMVRELADSTAHMSEADKVATLAKLVGTEAVSGFLSLISAGPAEIDKMTLSLQNSEGAAAETAAQMKDGIGGALENLSGAFESLTIIIGDVLVPYVQMAAEWLAKLAEKFTALSEGTMNFLVIGTAIVGIFSAIAAGIGIAMVVVGSIITSLGTLATALGIAGGAGGLLSAVFAAITGPIGIAVAAIAGIIAAVVLAYNKIDWFRDMVNAAWAKIKDLTVIAFEAIKKAITDAIAAVLAFVKPQLDKFKAFWDENGKQIQSLVKTYFESVATVIKGVMGVIKGVFQAVWPIISATVKAAWETIKLVVSTAINIVLGVVKTVLQVLQGDWKGAWETIKGTLVKIWADIGKYLKGIDLAQTGKDIIRGLIKGIASMGGAIKKTVSDLASKIPEWAKKILGIHSPSRVMAELGVFTGQGLANGVASTNPLIAKVAKDLGSILINVTKSNSAEVSKIAKDAEKERTKVQQEAATKRKELARKSGESLAVIEASANKKSGKLTKAQSLRTQNLRKDTVSKLAKIESDSAAKLAKINDKAWAQMQKKESEMSKSRLEAIKTFVDDKKSLEQLSLVAESEIWRKSTTIFKAGSKERVEAQLAYQKSLKAVNDEVVRINDEYSTKMQNINNNLAKNEQALTEEYRQAFSSRIDAISGFAGMFDKFEANVDKTGGELLNNLYTQVDGLMEWRAVLNSLWGKIDNQALMEQLQDMGPNALGELKALNSLSEDELTKYSELFNQKFDLARVQAASELKGMKEDTATRISELREEANTELEALRIEWTKQIKGLTKSTNDELTSLKSIGTNAAKGLMDGLASMEPSLIKKAKSIAEAVKGAMQSAFNIHSPSRWMRDMIGVNMMQGWINGMESMKSAVVNTATNFAGLMTPNPTLSYDTPSVNGASGGALRKLESEMQATLQADEASRGDIVLQVDGYEMARVQQPHLDRMQGSNNALRLYTKGRG